jgi:integrase
VIYFIQNTRTKSIKVGYALDPEKRLRHLQVASADPLVLLGVVPGEVADEKRLQRKFMDHQERGEWFRPGADLVAFIGQHAREATESDPTRPGPASDSQTPVPRRRGRGKRADIPAYRRHKHSRQAVVTLNGVDHYLGPWNSPESKAEYDRITSEWLALGRRLPDRGGEPREAHEADAMLVKELILGYYGHLAPTLPEVEVDKLRRALKPVRELFGETRAAEFGPVRFKAVRAKLVADDLCTSTINQRLATVRRMIAWGVENEMLPGDALHKLEAVAPLKAGRDAKAPKKVLPVSDADIDAVLPYLTPTVRTIVQLQRLTGMRPGEVIRLKTSEIDRTTDPWIYRPTKHKTQHLGKARSIPLGPKAQELLASRLKADPDRPIFSPRESRAHSDANRPHSEGSTEERRESWRRYYRKSHKRSTRHAGEMYSTRSYGNCVTKACKRAGVPPFRCNRIRHTYATHVRREHGLEAAQVSLGHSNAKTSEIYAERDLALAIKVARLIG